MKKLTSAFIFAFLSLALFAQTPEALKVKTYTLSNGMTVWINEDHSLPKAFGAVVVKAGAKDCPGTGIAHYFEHMMFKGTEKIGTIDYVAEKPYLDSISALYDQLAVASSDSLRKEIQLEINRLNIIASEFAIPNEFSNLVSECGGSNLNAYTSPDITVYHNQFVPAYLEQWAELNSERLMDPVFRLFQSELETVYEEKNRADGSEFSAFSNMIFSEGFKDSPYQYQVIGTTENLKNPQLSQMKAFFDKYYVANNMGLMLTGDIDAKKALPILEKTFGRIRKGNLEPAAPVTLAQFQGRKEVTALAKIPIIKISIMCFRAPSKKEEDCLPLSFLAFLLNNSEGIGLLDKLITDRKLLGAFCMYPSMAFEEAGAFPILYMPKLLFQSSKKAEANIMKVLDQVKAGDFSQEFFNSCKNTFKRNLISGIEGTGSRMNEMVNAFAEGKKWEDVIAQSDRIDALTKEDVVALANKYLGEDYLVISKKFGNPEKDNLQKPPYKKVLPKNSGSASAYAQAIRKSADKVVMPRVKIDFEKGADRTAITDKVTLYTVKNELNDVFELRISYPVGTPEQPDVENLAQYINLLGSQTMDYETLRAKLQELGGSVAFEADKESFDIIVSGFDKTFEGIFALVSDLVDNPKGDKAKLKIIKQNEITSKIMLKRDISNLDQALYSKVMYGEDSYYLKKKGKIADETYMKLLEEILSTECDVHYSGTLAKEDVARIVGSAAFVGKAVKEHPYYPERKLAQNSGKHVYFVKKKKASQSRINAIIVGDPNKDFTSRYASQAFADYVGGGMGSLLFQEIREFRSMAYATGSWMTNPLFVNAETVPSVFTAYVGTQCDKTIEAMAVIDSLLTELPLDENRAKMTAKDKWFERVNGIPGFRYVSIVIAQNKRSGIKEDVSDGLYDLLTGYGTDDVKRYWDSQVAGRDIIWTVVGDPKKFPMEELSKYGEITTLKVKDIIK